MMSWVPFSVSRDHFLCRLFNRVGLTKLVSNVHPSVCPCTKHLFDFNEIWYVGTGRQVMHDGMQYDPIQGQGQGHEPYKVGTQAIFKSYLLHHLQWELATDHGLLN